MTTHRHWIPSWYGIETRSSTVGVGTNSNVVESTRVGVDSRVDETNRLLASKDAFLVDTGDDSGKGWRGGSWRTIRYLAV